MQRRGEHPAKERSRAGRHLPAALGIVVALLFPFLWMVLTSLKAPEELFASGFPSMVPRSLGMVRVVVEVAPGKTQTEDRAREGEPGKISSQSFPLAKAGNSAETVKASKQWSDLAESLAGLSGVVRVHAQGSKGVARVEATLDGALLSVDGFCALLTERGYLLRGSPLSTSYPLASEYLGVFDKIPFAGYLYNSCVVASLTTALCLLVGTLCAFALARLQFAGRDALLALILAVSMFPPIAVVSPLFMILKHAHLLNTRLALIMPYTAFGLPLTVWTLRAFFRKVPRELDESARIDGCTRSQALWYVVLPVVAPGLATCGILVFIAAWNEFLFGLVFITKDTLRTVPVGVMLLPGQYEMPWTTVFAAATMVTLPLVLVVFLFQKRLVEGLTAGAVKG